MNTQATVLSENTEESKPKNVIECINPATGKILGSVSVTLPEDVAGVVQRARVAQKSWADSTFKQRRAVLGHIMKHILDNADELVEAVVNDSGKTYDNAMLGEILPICTKIRWLIKNGEKHLKPESVSSGMFVHKRARIEYVPLGVVACIIPWNYPLQNIISSLVAPLMAGNAVVLKASEAVAWSVDRFQKITDEALKKEGFSCDTVQVINGYGETGAALVESGVDKILFIGSVGNGRRIIQASAEHLTPVVMELGGKDPFIVCDDADLDKAVYSALGGSFINLGQNCIAAERVIVHQGIYERFLKSLTEKASKLRQGVPVKGGNVDVGAITSPQQIAIIDRLVNDAISKGARAIVGGEVRVIGEGSFYPPTILIGVTPVMDIYQEEIFGPVMIVMKVADDSEAIEVANCTNFGLHSSVITKDAARGERIAARLQAGATCINDFGLCYLNQDLPFGGVKYSGYGRMNGREGLRAYTNHKAVLSDRFSIEIPPKIFPVRVNDYETAKSMIRVMFSSSIREKITQVCKLIWLSVTNRD